jgi:hypothetical protein
MIDHSPCRRHPGNRKSRFPIFSRSLEFGGLYIKTGKSRTLLQHLSLGSIVLTHWHDNRTLNNGKKGGELVQAAGLEPGGTPLYIAPQAQAAMRCGSLKCCLFRSRTAFFRQNRISTTALSETVLRLRRNISCQNSISAWSRYLLEDSIFLPNRQPAFFVTRCCCNHP